MQRPVKRYAVILLSACSAWAAAGAWVARAAAPPANAAKGAEGKATEEAADRAADRAAKKAAAAARAAEAAKKAAERAAEKAAKKAAAEAAKAAEAAELAKLDWPPRQLADRVAITESPTLLETPPQVRADSREDGYAAFTVATSPPRLLLTLPGKLGEAPAARRLWSSWGDICLARDGSVYVGIGDHHHDAAGDARCFLYRWDPRSKTLRQIVDMNKIVAPREGQPAWSKVHAKIDEGPDGKIYFCCTLNAGNAAGDPKYGWTEHLPGAQLYRYDPQTGATEVFANLPPRRCTATSLLDAARGIWWCNLEAGAGDALYGLDLKTRRVVFQSEDGAVAFNRNFALDARGAIHFNGAEGEILRWSRETGKIEKTGAAIPAAPGMRASSRESRDGVIYGVTYKTNQLFAYRVDKGEVKLLGPTWGQGEYTTVVRLSPDERFLYYFPGAHGKAFHYGTPVVQYEIATGARKVLAFLAPTLERELSYVPGGTYGFQISEDGGSLFVNFNGHAADSIRPAAMRPIGFGLCSFAVIEIPQAER